jgi:cytochrome c oxidase subunit II
MRLLTVLKATGATLMLMAGAAFAQDLPILGQPLPDGIAFQPPATLHAVDQHWLDNFLLVIITVITIFVTLLMAWCIVRYNAKRNPTPATFTHNSPIEVAWTVIPIIILVVIGAFSLPVLFKDQQIPTADITIKATGYQWYWGYEYVDNEVAFDSYMIGSPFTGGSNMMTPEVSAQLSAAGYTDQQFLLATDTAVVVPVGKTVVMQVTGGDVIHSWKMPAFGIMQDGVPGRLASLWFKVEQEGIYFGQCSELCGQMHAYMPITVKAVSQDVYDAWIAANEASDDYIDVSTLMVADAATAPATAIAANE